MSNINTERLEALAQRLNTMFYDQGADYDKPVFCFPYDGPSGARVDRIRITPFWLMQDIRGCLLEPAGGEYSDYLAFNLLGVKILKDLGFRIETNIDMEKQYFDEGDLSNDFFKIFKLKGG